MEWCIARERGICLWILAKCVEPSADGGAYFISAQESLQKAYDFVRHDPYLIHYKFMDMRMGIPFTTHRSLVCLEVDVPEQIGMEYASLCKEFSQSNDLSDALLQIGKNSIEQVRACARSFQSM